MDFFKKEKDVKIKNKTKKDLKDKTKLNKKKVIIISTVIIILLIAVGVLLGLTIFNSNWKEANKNYYVAFEIANNKNKELDELISKSEKLVYSNEPALDENLKPTLETAISEAKAVKKKLPRKPLLTRKINETTFILNDTNYEKEYNNLKLKYEGLDKSIKQYALVFQPTEAYIIECLKNIPHIKNIAAVTEENDPNGNLNKPGGYTATVYYSDDRINLDKDIYGKTVIEQGTESGGSIEVYATVEDAEKREQYLAGFDGGLLASGSHKVVGTVLVRTSNELTASQQKEMEKYLISALTGEEIKVEEKKEEKKEEKVEKVKAETPKKSQTTKKEPSYYSVVGTYSGPEGTIHFYQDGTLYMSAIDDGSNYTGEPMQFNVYGTWTQNGNKVSCTIRDDYGSMTPQSITVSKNGISGWWGQYYSKN